MNRYKTYGPCSRQIDFDVIDGKLANVRFIGGCNGNLKGIAALVEGMEVDVAIQRLQGISCNGRPTSCPDQLAQALMKYKSNL